QSNHRRRADRLVRPAAAHAASRTTATAAVAPAAGAEDQRQGGCRQQREDRTSRYKRGSASHVKTSRAPVLSVSVAGARGGFRGSTEMNRRERQPVCRPRYPSSFGCGGAVRLRGFFRLAAQLAGQGEEHVLLTAGDLARRLRTPAAELLEHLLHQQLGRRGSGGHADGALAREPFGAQVRRAVDQIAGYPGTVGELAQAVGVGAGARTHHQQHVALLEKLLDGVLAVLGRVADVLAA